MLYDAIINIMVDYKEIVSVTDIGSASSEAFCHRNADSGQQASTYV